MIGSKCPFLMVINSHINSLFQSICYQIDNCLIDPGDIIEWYKTTKYVLLTHAHFDHIYGLNELLRNSPTTKVFTNEYGKGMLLDAKKNMSFYHETPFILDFPDNIVIVQDREEIELDNGIKAKAIFTPGHNPSCITWIMGEALFSGDSYIPGIRTVTNLPGGNKREAAQSLKLIKEISKDMAIYPGHQI